MNTKTCRNCGNSFTSKRSDALYCSTECRAQGNYKKKREKINPQNTPLSPPNSLTGEFSYDDVITMVQEVEDKILYTQQCIEQLTKEDTILAHNKAVLIEEITLLEEDKIKKLELSLQLPNDVLYNKYINTEYINARKLKNPNALKYFKTELDIDSYSNKTLKQQLNDFKHQLQRKFITTKSEAALLKSQLLLEQEKIENNKTYIKEKVLDLRFLQSRIVRYENLLSGK